MTSKGMTFQEHFVVHLACMLSKRIMLSLLWGQSSGNLASGKSEVPE